jgi:hypothetical protein
MNKLAEFEAIKAVIAAETQAVHNAQIDSAARIERNVLKMSPEAFFMILGVRWPEFISDSSTGQSLELPSTKNYPPQLQSHQAG